MDVVGGAFTEFGNSPQKLADRLVAMYGGNWIFEKMSEESRGRGRVQKYSWEQQESAAGERSFLEIFVSDSKIISFQRQFTVEDTYSST